MRRAAIIVLVWSLAGCAGWLGALATITQGAQLLGSAIDAADVGQERFFARHPDLTAQNQIDRARDAARLGLRAYNRAAMAATSADDGDLKAAKAAALESYEILHKLLEKLGVLDGKAPAGGADGAGPPVQPLDLPTVGEIDAQT